FEERSDVPITTRQSRETPAGPETAEQRNCPHHLSWQDREDVAALRVLQRSRRVEALNHTGDGNGFLQDAFDESAYTGDSNEESSCPQGVVSRAFLTYARQLGFVEPAHGDRRLGDLRVELVQVSGGCG